MKAAVYRGHRTFAVGTSEPVAPGPGEVRLNVAYCGVCGTDVHIFHGAMDGRVQPPKIIGHEASAEVAEIGEGVAVGDRVAVRPLRFGTPTPFDKGSSHVGKNLKH
jgi:(R,R)-butanediol dehydrogenase/meso-butanediol dehydrogenase/diacetyl reductase